MYYAAAGVKDQPAVCMSPSQGDTSTYKGFTGREQMEVKAETPNIEKFLSTVSFLQKK